MPLQLSDGSAYGRIKNVEDFGAGDVLEIALEAGGTEFAAAHPPDRSRRSTSKAGRVVVDPPAVRRRFSRTLEQERAAAHG